MNEMAIFGALRQLLIAWFALLPVTLLAADMVRYGPEPGWLAPVSVEYHSEAPLDVVLDGAHYLHFERQVRVPPSGDAAYYFRYVMQITNQAGLDNQSQINISFDPIYERIELHRLRVIRDGKILDRLRDTPLRLLDQEEDLDHQIYNGTKTANLLLEDLRVGDLLDYSYSFIGNNPVFDDVFNARFRLQWEVPISSQYFRLLWQKDRPLITRAINGAAQLEPEVDSEGAAYIVRQTEVAPKILEEDTPDWFDPYPMIFFSEQQQWSEVVDWGRGLFRNSVVGSDQIRDIADDIRRKSARTDDRIVAALQFVQDNIRYVGIELGINSHQAAPAPTVLARRYGDCKDKTSLLVAILDELGITAYPALVNTSERAEIEKHLPSMRSFDHVLVALPHDGKLFWLDPTRSQQKGRLEQIYQPDYGRALILRDGENALSDMASEASISGYEIREHFDFNAYDDDTIRFSVATEYFGANAERQISRFEQDGLNQIAQRYLEWYQNFFPQITPLQSPQTGFSSDSRFSIDEAYRIEDFWEAEPEENRDVGWVYSSSINSYLEQPEKRSRTQVYNLGDRVSVSQHIRLSLEKARDWQFDSFDFEEDNDFFNYRVKERFDPAGKELTLEYHYANKTDRVPPERYEEYLAALERADEQTNFGFYRFAPEYGQDSEHGPIAIAIGLLAYLSLVVFIVVLWRIELGRRPYDGEMIYYPVDRVKFVFLWIFTVGLFPVYWFYRLWRYEKSQQNNSGLWPFLGGLFYSLSFYWAYRAVAEHMRKRQVSAAVPGKMPFILLALLMLAVSLVGGYSEDLWLPALLFGPLLALPLLTMINESNRDHPAAIEHNSRWAPRHALLVVFSLPIYLYSAGSTLGFLPASGVVEGDRLIGRDIRFLQRNGVVRPGDRIAYFYSDAFWSTRTDGNGFSERHIFSYWRDDDNRLNVEVVEFTEVDDIRVHWAEHWYDNTTIEILRRDGSSFTLYVPAADREDHRFVEAMKARWHTPG